jgi:D-alanyl-D-alanine dipeptidase
VSYNKGQGKGVAAMLQTAAEMRHSHSTGEQIDNTLVDIQPGPTRTNGMEIDYPITNKGKQNKLGNFSLIPSLHHT